MKIFIDPANFEIYFNLNNVGVRTIDTYSVDIQKEDVYASLIMQAIQDYKEYVTIEFVLRFENKKITSEGRVFQREFSIEHHPPEKSQHTEPHIQLYIHGPLFEEKIGKLWINLPLENKEAYNKYIKGFFFILKEIIEKCDPGLEKSILNTREVMRLTEQKNYLKRNINYSLKHNKIEYKPPEGKSRILKFQELPMLLKKDTSLILFFR